MYMSLVLKITFDGNNPKFRDELSAFSGAPQEGIDENIDQLSRAIAKISEIMYVKHFEH